MGYTQDIVQRRLDEHHFSDKDLSDLVRAEFQHSRGYNRARWQNPISVVDPTNTIAFALDASKLPLAALQYARNKAEEAHHHAQEEYNALHADITKQYPSRDPRAIKRFNAQHPESVDALRKKCITMLMADLKLALVDYAKAMKH